MEMTDRRRWVVLAVLSAVAFMAQLDLFIVNVGLPAMARSFHEENLANLSWVLNAYAIVFAALLVPAGRLADHYGRRVVLLAGVVLFTAASVLCAVGPDLAVVIVGRTIQAIGAAMIVPTSLGLLLPVFPASRHGMVVGIWAGVASVAASSGPPVGGLLVSVDWRWIFLVNVPIGVATIIAGLIVLPEIRAERGARLPDSVSVVAVLATVLLLTFATTEGHDWGWTSGREGLLALGFLLSLAVAVRRIVSVPHAVIEPRLFASREFTASTVALLLYTVGLATWLLLTILFFTDQWRYGTVRTGLAIAPGPLVAAVFALNSGRLSGRLGRKPLAIAGSVSFLIAALYWLIVTPATPDYVTGFLPGLIFGGMSAGLIQAPLFAAASSLPPDRATTGSAVLNMARQIGSALGVAILVALLGTANPDRLSLFHRGWLFMLIVGAVTAVTAAFGLPREQGPSATLVKGSSEPEVPAASG